MALPTEITLTFNTIAGFDYLTNSGTWFISSIFVCYLLFPYMQQCVRASKPKTLLSLLVIIYIIEGIPRYYPSKLGIPNYLYTNTFFRILEFLFGVLEAKIFVSSLKVKNSKWNRISFWFCIVFLTVLISRITLYKNSLHSVRAEWPVFTMPIFALLLWSAAAYNGKIFVSVCHSKIVQLFSKISYQFWIATFFTTYVLDKCFYLESNNIRRIILSLIINFVISLILYAIQYACEYVYKWKADRVSITRLFSLVFLLTAAWISVLGVLRKSSISAYDYEHMQIAGDGTVGTYGDEGAFTWLAPQSEFTMKANTKKLRIKLATNKIALEKVEDRKRYMDVYVNDYYVSTLHLEGKMVDYEIDLSTYQPDINNARKYKVSLQSKFAFVPKEIVSESTDSRELSAQLFYIGN